MFSKGERANGWNNLHLDEAVFAKLEVLRGACKLGKSCTREPRRIYYCEWIGDLTHRGCELGLGPCTRSASLIHIFRSFQRRRSGP